MKITFIGGGNMATALISGLRQARDVPEWIRASDPDPSARERLESDYGVQCHEHAAPAIEGADLIVLAVKPQIMPAVLEEIGHRVQADQVLLSIAAGISVETLQCAFDLVPAIVRAMPNTPALIGMGISGAFAAQPTDKRAMELAETVLRAAGDVVWIEDESLMDVVTAVSGSGPAYFFLLVEAMRDAGAALGLDPETATRLAVKTAAGAGAMAADSELDVGELRRRVTSPGGTTQAALEAFAGGDFNRLVEKAVLAATRRGQELSGKEARNER